MTRLEWKEIVGKTKWVSKKQRLSKKELNSLLDAQLAVGSFKQKSGFKEKLLYPQSLKEILRKIREL